MLPSKQFLRKKYRNSVTQSISLSIINNIQALIKKNTKIAIYYPIKGEPDLLQITEQNLLNLFCLPKIINDSMVFTAFDKKEKLVSNALYPNMLESHSNNEIKPDIMFVPGLAFDIKGYRLGRGKGHYDKYIALNPDIKTIGVIFQEKLIEFLLTEPHDCKMQYIITENLILRL